MNNCGPSQPTIDRAERNRKDREKYARNVAQRESRNLRRRRALDASAKEKEKRLSDARGANHSNAIPVRNSNASQHNPFTLTPMNDCTYCGAKRFQYEPPGFCCSRGQITLISNEMPTILRNLFVGQNTAAKHFQASVRTYNNTFAFTSLGIQNYDKDLCRRNKGIYTFKVQGQMYHFVNDLLPNGCPPRNLQLYFFDTEHELENRLQGADRMDRDIVSALIQLMLGNPYGQFFRSLKDIAQTDEFNIILRSDISMDQRTHNMPSASQVAAIWIEDNGDGLNGNRNIRVHSHSGRSQYIQYYYGCYDPLQYPLLFPHGDIGWHEGIQRVSSREHVGTTGSRQTPKSFDNIKTVNGNQAVTFREAAENLGLLSGDHIVEKCLDEAVLYQMPSSFRRLFATLLIYCDISNPRNLWNKFKSYMCEDLLRTRLHTDDEVQVMVLQLIANAVEKMGKKIDDFNLVDDRLSISTQEKEDREIAAEYNIQIGDGTEQLVGRDKIKIPSSFIIPCTNEDTSLDALFQSVYPDLTCFETDPYSLMSKAILTPKNEIADEINSILIDRFPGEIPKSVRCFNPCMFSAMATASSSHGSSRKSGSLIKENELRKGQDCPAASIPCLEMAQYSSCSSSNSGNSLTALLKHPS
nr:uncharacterized protein LOC109183853 isoform X1 [Ipomoea batatas]